MLGGGLHDGGQPAEQLSPQRHHPGTAPRIGRHRRQRPPITENGNHEIHGRRRRRVDGVLMEHQLVQIAERPDLHCHVPAQQRREDLRCLRHPRHRAARMPGHRPIGLREKILMTHGAEYDRTAVAARDRVRRHTENLPALPRHLAHLSDLNGSIVGPALTSTNTSRRPTGPNLTDKRVP